MGTRRGAASMWKKRIDYDYDSYDQWFNVNDSMMSMIVIIVKLLFLLWIFYCRYFCSALQTLRATHAPQPWKKACGKAVQLPKKQTFQLQRNMMTTQAKLNWTVQCVSICIRVSEKWWLIKNLNGHMSTLFYFYDVLSRAPPWYVCLHAFATPPCI